MYAIFLQSNLKNDVRFYLNFFFVYHSLIQFILLIIAIRLSWKVSVPVEWGQRIRRKYFHRRNTFKTFNDHVILLVRICLRFNFLVRWYYYFRSRLAWNLVVRMRFVVWFSFAVAKLTKSLAFQLNRLMFINIFLNFIVISFLCLIDDFDDLLMKYRNLCPLFVWMFICCFLFLNL